MVEAAIALAVAAIPEGLPIVATLVLARGMWRMAEKNAVIERLAAVETLGATTVIFTDKTGTLTENNMTVRRIVTATADVTIADARAFPLDAVMRRLLRAAVLCNDAVLDAPGQTAIGDPLELALLAAARLAGVEQSALSAAHPETARSAFDNALRMMATAHACDGRTLLTVKGAPEAVIDRAAFVATADGDVPMDDGIRAEWHARTEASEPLGSQGARLRRARADDSDGDPYRAITLLGLAGLYDPPRTDVRDAIAACRRAGIRVIMVTGDHAVTAASIAGEIGLTATEPRVVEGRHLDQPDGVADSDPPRDRRVRPRQPGAEARAGVALSGGGARGGDDRRRRQRRPRAGAGRHRRRDGLARHRGRAAGRSHGAARRRASPPSSPPSAKAGPSSPTSAASSPICWRATSPR